MLSKYDLYPKVGGNSHTSDNSAIMWTLFYSGERLSDIAEKTGISMDKIVSASEILKQKGLIK
jgi:aminopeptidase-like protein